MKVLWITSGSIHRDGGAITSPLASARYRILVPAAEMARHGVESEFLGKEELERGNWQIPPSTDAVVISKSGHTIVENIALEARRHGAAIIVDFCDDHFSSDRLNRHHSRLAELADIITVSANELGNVVNRLFNRPTQVIYDPYEGPRGTPTFDANKSPLNLLWFGAVRNLPPLADVLPDLDIMARHTPLTLNVVTQPGTPHLDPILAYTRGETALRVTITPWTLEANWRALAQCDMVIIPATEERKFLVKGPDRIVESLWAGRCVAAYPLQSYREFSSWAFLDTELCSAIETAIDQADSVSDRIRGAQEYIAAHYNPTTIGQQWFALIQSTANAVRANPQSATSEKTNVATSLRLNLGCGDKHLDGYVNVDVVDERLGKRPDVICDIRKLEAFSGNTADEILAVHVIEHLWRWEVVDVLREWVRVLKPGGSLVLECPNLITACEEFLRNPRQAAGPGAEGQRTMWVFYGDPKWRDPLMIHRWGYTPDSLGDIMREAGLTNVRQEKAQFKLREPRDMRVVGVKPA